MEGLVILGSPGSHLAFLRDSSPPVSSLLPAGMTFLQSLCSMRLGLGPLSNKALRFLGDLHTSSLGTRLVTSGHIALKPTVATVGLQ